MRKIIPSFLAALAVVAAPAVAAPRETPEAQFQKLLAGRVAGEPTNCISLSSVTETQVIAGKAIVYRVGGRLYVNQPRSGATQLRDDDVLVTRSVGGQLCSIDTVELVDRSSQIARGFVVLGTFVPYSKARRAG